MPVSWKSVFGLTNVQALKTWIATTSKPVSSLASLTTASSNFSPNFTLPPGKS